MDPRVRLGGVMIGAGGATIALGLVLAAVVGEPLILVAVPVGVADVILGFLFRTGVLGAEARTASASATETQLGDADGEPIAGDANPYARED